MKATSLDYQSMNTCVSRSQLDSLFSSYSTTQIEPHIHRVETPDETYVYKESDWDDTSVAAEPFVIEHLRQETTIPLPQIYHKQPDADPPWFVMEYLDGDQPRHAHELPIEYVVEYAEKLGQFVAEMHELTLSDVGQLIHVDGGFKPLGATSQSQADYKREFRLQLDEFRVQANNNQFDIRESFYELPVPTPSKLTYCPIDFHTQNLLVDGTDVTGVVDFERLYAGHPRWGFEQTLYMLTVTRRGDESEWITDRFSKGYSDVRPIPEYHPVFELASILREMRAIRVWWEHPEEHRPRLEEQFDTVWNQLQSSRDSG